MVTVDGFINLNKPAGWTSHDCVAKVRRLLHMKRVGHGGTLDPAATGVLPIALGRATRLLPYLPDDKAYQAIIRFGIRTTTDDLDGDALTTNACPHLNLEDLTALLLHFQGNIQQIPPKYSAIQVGGKRLYELARAGVEVEVPVRTVKIHNITVLNWRSGDFPELKVAIACGGGTYIRAIARDLGDMAGVGATLAHLSRTHSSGFSLSHSISIDDLMAQTQQASFQPVPPQQALSHLPQITLSPEQTDAWFKGQAIADLIYTANDTVFPDPGPRDPCKQSPSENSSSEKSPASPPPTIVQVCNRSNQFLGIGHWPDPANRSPSANPTSSGSFLQPKVVFN